MNPRLERNIPALSEEECAILAGKRAVIAGCGGLGGYLIELMARIGIGELCVIDGDVFELSNLNRQLLSTCDLLGQEKSGAAARRIAQINPDVKVTSIQTFLTQHNVQELIAGYDVVLDALDSIESRRILAKACSDLKIPFIHGAIRGWSAQAAISMPEDHLMDLIYPEHAVLNDKSVLSFTPALCASMQASLCVRLLTGRPVETGTIYYYDLLNQDFEQIKL